jgi:carbonic anhydrase
MRLHLAAVFVLSFGGLALGQTTTTPWSYSGKTGPLGWSRLDPAYKICAEGHEQSPVDIRGARLNKNLPPIEFHYMGGAVTLENTGNTVRVYVNPGSYIVYDSVRYDLQQFHFHHPSEEAVKGKLTDMVVHLVHQSADGKIAVVAIRFTMDRGEPNTLLASLWPHLPQKAGEKEKLDEMINPGGFLPADRGYWTYTGSLTAPPCTEGVRWLIFEDVLSMSRTQLNTFKAIYPMNSRPLQELHGRRIEANE